MPKPGRNERLHIDAETGHTPRPTGSGRPALTRQARKELEMKHNTMIQAMQRYQIADLSQAASAMRFTREVLEAEKEHIQQTEPYATEAIKSIESAITEIGEVMADQNL